MFKHFKTITDAKTFYVTGGGLGACYLTGTPSFKTVDEMYQNKKVGLFLEKITDGVYRIHSRNKKYPRDTRNYQVECPICHSRMKEIGPARNEHILQAFQCVYCFNE